MAQPTIQFKRDGERITWLCSGCGFPIAGQDGFLNADMQQVNRVEQEWQEFKTDHGDAFTVADLLDGPDKVPWLAWHTDCASDPEGPPYSIDVHRIDTRGKLLHWTGHLMRKSWLRVTDFAALLDRVGDDA